MFSDITFSFYKQRLNTTMLEGRVELDETLVLKKKLKQKGIDPIIFQLLGL